MRHNNFYLWLGGSAVALAAAFIGYSATLTATRTAYPLWTSNQMLTAYSFGSVALLCFIAAVRGWSFPLVKEAHHDTWEVIGLAAGGHWGVMIWPPRGGVREEQGILRVVLECYQRGAIVNGLRCFLTHPSGTQVVGTNSVVQTFDRDHFNHEIWDYPTDFDGPDGVPPALTGTYHVRWLAKVPGEPNGAIELCSYDVEVTMPDPAPSTEAADAEAPS